MHLNSTEFLYGTITASQIVNSKKWVEMSPKLSPKLGAQNYNKN